MTKVLKVWNTAWIDRQRLGRGSSIVRSSLFSRPAAVCLLLSASLLHAGSSGKDWPYFGIGKDAKIPPHDNCGEEIKSWDEETRFIWKFGGAGEEGGMESALADVESLLAERDLDSDEDNRVQILDSTSAKTGLAPKLVGGATAAPDGRFGPGLELDGTGCATTSQHLTSLLRARRGFCLDFWVRPQAPGAGRDEVLATLGDPKDDLPLRLHRKADGRIAVWFKDRERVVTPTAAAPTDKWTHLALGLSLNRSEGHLTAHVSIGVNGRNAGRGALAKWPLEEVDKRGGLRTGKRMVAVGAARGLPGFRGVVDEVRFRERVRHFYPWDVPNQVLGDPRSPAAMALPYLYFDDVSAHLPFDGNLEPRVYAGASHTGKAGAEHFREGMKGKALDLSRVDGTEFSLRGLPAFAVEDGTLEFFFRPLDWHNMRIERRHVWHKSAGRLLLLTQGLGNVADAADHPTARLNVFQAHQRQQTGRRTDAAWGTIFHPGRWTHVLVSTRDSVSQVYLDGTLQPYPQVAMTHNLGSAAEIAKWKTAVAPKGGVSESLLRFKSSPTLIDEFRVYPWPFDHREAWNAYARWLPDAAEKMTPLPAFDVAYDYQATSRANQQKLKVEIHCHPVNRARPVAADVAIRNDREDLMHDVTKLELDRDGKARIVIERTFGFGRYTVRLRSRDARGDVLKEEDLEYVREKPAWMGNTLGQERTAPAPWSPVVVAGREMQVWGRKVTLGPGGLPAAVETLGRRLLAAPVTVNVRSTAGAARLTGAELSFTDKGDDRVDWKGRLEGAGLTARLEAWMEFDGLIYTTIDLRPTDGAKMQVLDLDVDFPLDGAQVFHLIANGGGKDVSKSWLAQEIPRHKSGVWNSRDAKLERALTPGSFLPHIWLGGDHVGLHFCGENDRGWTPDDSTPAQEVLRVGDTVVMRLNVISRPVEIDGTGRRFHFSILPTPAKPEPEGWRRLAMLGGYDIYAVDTFKFTGLSLKMLWHMPQKDDGLLLEPRAWDHAAWYASTLRSVRGRSLFYMHAVTPRPGPAFREWGYDLTAGSGQVSWSPMFEDYAVWALDEWIRRDLIDGIYLDGVCVGRTSSLKATAYEFPGSSDGRRMGFTFMGQRRFLKRIWRLFQAHDKTPGISATTTLSYELPMFSFCRYVFNSGVGHTADFWNPDNLRILGGATKWGTGMMFERIRSPGKGAASGVPWAQGLARAQTGLFGTADVHNFLTLPTELRQAIGKAGVLGDGEKAYPWWLADAVVELDVAERDAVQAAVYAAGDHAVVVLFNRTREECDAALSLKTLPLFGREGEITWKELVPKIKPPVATKTTRADTGKAGPRIEEANILGKSTIGEIDTLGAENPVNDEAIDSVVSGSGPQESASGRLALRTEGARARIVISPHDCRVLEARIE